MADSANIAAIVLAAGSAQRFGSNKLLHPVTLDGTTLPLAAHSLRPWLQVFSRITVIVRTGSEAFIHAIEQASASTGHIDWAICPQAETGMAASLADGVRKNRDAAGWIIGLADMPQLPLAAIRDVRQALTEGAFLAAACRAGKRGHPAGFSARYRDELLALRGDSGGRHIFERDAALVHRIEIPDDGIFTDIDSPNDLKTLEQKGNEP